MSQGLVTASYIVAAVLFILSLAGLSKQETAKYGNWFGIVGMAIALIAKAVSSRISPELYQQLANGWPLPQETESQGAIPASINEATTKDPDRPQ